MFAVVVASIAALALTPPTLAQNTTDNDRQYTVWSSVILTRTGERTPEILGNIPTTLTAVGANQAYQAGQFFRQRYIESAYDRNRTGSNGAEYAGAPLYGLNTDVFGPMQLFAIALEQQYNQGTAQAFMQGLYPPWTPDSNTSTPGMVSPTNVLANGTYVVSPLDGCQYPQVHATGPMDYNYIYLSGNLNCPSWQQAAAAYTTSQNFGVTQEDFDNIYNAIGPAVFEGVLDSRFWDYTNAYAIYDYLRYQYAYNDTVKQTLDRYYDVKTNTTYLNILRWLADEQQFAQLGNVSAVNSVSNEKGLPGLQGSISTIAGNMLGARIMDGLTDAITNSQDGSYKLNLLFADYHPFLSFFSLVGLPELNSNFYGTPNFASSAVFELFSYTNSTGPKTFPDDSDLWVRFYFRNGTEDGEEYRAYPLFNRGPDQTDMMWSDFQYQMFNLLMVDVGDWCTLCNSTNIFCAAWRTDEAKTLVQDWAKGHGLVSTKNRHRMKPAVAGVIGAIIALVVAGVIFGLVMLLAGVRFHRNQRSPRSSSDFGGFKGGQKMRSDQDLTIPKGGAVVGASVETSSTSPHGGHERVGSWELKSTNAGHNPFTLNVPQQPEMRQSMDSVRRSLDPHGVKPAEPRNAF
ncbi:hypothetical protein AC578_280 [Pseudocercospora eumusae]|uniref:Histidine acid phosphatase n=1 Tax=Pseudocercospora eumusae TaxID=321146 RepID=A0A139H6Z9_9PEZI|nr:hypothetical protein AC578_280 [Pseudocercospora eumusae]